VLSVTASKEVKHVEKKKELVTDPVCGMKIDPATAAGNVQYQGQTIYFCAKSCEQEFKKNPKKYIAKLRK
jgi:Cu+-exporting ATPase